MPNPLRSGWRWLFPKLQRALPVHHGKPLLAGLDRAAQVFHHLYENGHYDPATNGEAWLLQALSAQQPAVILDVGVNVGDYSCLALAHCPSAEIHCFEPMPAVFTDLEVRLGDEPHVHLHQQALAAENGTCTFYFDPRATGNTTALAEDQSGIHGLNEVTQVDARTQTLDSFCKEQGIDHVDLLKIDVEGFESSVLKGGRNDCRGAYFVHSA